MTNAEVYQEVFGFPPDTSNCPTNQCDICPGHDSFRCATKVNFWEKEYTRPTDSPCMYGDCPNLSDLKDEIEELKNEIPIAHKLGQRKIIEDIKDIKSNNEYPEYFEDDILNYIEEWEANNHD